ncbi:alanine:cation symporter family protein [Prevotella sp. E13-17]|uniref:alanine/glycine:cation symporter family protein n=1 Tax=Prevotella sp. E13-17 TaxID=2913616 RepID=UPI001EDA305C|nr:alanine/glycine:cation symporter family protein [Prevotella sp. E13-17]UKK51283.1 alanine:cation symporter family protein [Prevotella sp. E13-17]
MDINQLITQVNDALWTYVLIGALVGCGLWFTWRTRFVQLRMLGEMIRLLTDSAVDTTRGVKHISSFQAFAVSVATRVGTGNLAGVASAIAIGGPGAVFWMWVIALIGAATAFVESTLAQLFKRKHQDSFIGGPAYYIQYGLHQRWMAITFAVLITCQFGLSNNSIQSNTICCAMQEAFGWSPLWVGISLSLMALLIVFGGIQRIAKVSSVLVPVMAIGYVVLAVFIIVTNIEKIPIVMKVILADAFGIHQVAGGGIGATIMYGVKRGLFSNEAGEGSAPNVAATAATSHPVKQGLIQALGVFTDTLLVCSCTAFIILISGLYCNSELNGIALTQSALQSEVGSAGPVFVAVAIFLFAFSSIIGNYYYGEANIRFITNDNKVMTAYRIFSGGVMVLFGALASFELVWNVVDFFMAFLTLCNLIAIVLLGRYVFRLLDDYNSQKRRGIKEPAFHRSQFPELEKELECWE